MTHIMNGLKSSLFWFLLISIISLPLLFLGMNDIISQLGVIPRDVSDLWSVFTSTFVHGSLSHYISNMSALVVLLVISYMTYRKNFMHMIIIGLIIISGLITWMIGREASHLGASSLIFGLISFLIFAGIFSGKVLNIIISVGIAFFYGGTVIIGILPTNSYVSWEGHLGGFMAGMLLAYLNKKYLMQNKNEH